MCERNFTDLTYDFWGGEGVQLVVERGSVKRTSSAVNLEYDSARKCQGAIVSGNRGCLSINQESFTTAAVAECWEGAID